MVLAICSQVSRVHLEPSCREKTTTNLTSFEVVWHRRPNVTHLYSFGVKNHAIAAIKNQLRFGHFCPESRSYFLKWLDNNTLGLSRNGIFHESNSMKSPTEPPTHESYNKHILHDVNEAPDPSQKENLPTPQTTSTNDTLTLKDDDNNYEPSSTSSSHSAPKNFSDIDTRNINHHKRIPKRTCEQDRI